MASAAGEPPLLGTHPSASSARLHIVVVGSLSGDCFTSSKNYVKPRLKSACATPLCRIISKALAATSDTCFCVARA